MIFEKRIKIATYSSTMSSFLHWKTAGAGISDAVTIAKSICKYPTDEFLLSPPIFSKIPHFLMNV